MNPLSVNTSYNPSRIGEITARCNQAMDKQDTANINIINIKNLFDDEEPNTRLSYMNYCAVTQDFNTYHIDEDALRILESFGFNR